jgi:phosphoribosyl-AMP cyclohydrolase
MTGAEGFYLDRGSKEEVEHGHRFTPKFDSDGLIPCVVTDVAGGDVLMVAYMNAESLAMTLKVGEAVFYSRSRKELWHKGQTSGNVQKVKTMRIDCDQDCIWLSVEQVGGAACHTGQRTCFYRSVDLSGSGELEDSGEQPLFDPAKVYG